MKKFSFGPNLWITLALGAIGVAQFVLNNQKEAKEMERLKLDVKKEILKDLSKETK